MSDKWIKPQTEHQDSVLEYAVNEVKSDVKDIKSDIKGIHECLTNMEKTLAGLPCSVHSLRADTLEKRVDKLEPQMDDAKGYINKAVGALVLLTLIIQLVGPIVLTYAFPGKKEAAVDHKPKVSIVQPSSYAQSQTPILTHTNYTNGQTFGTIQVGAPKP